VFELETLQNNIVAIAGIAVVVGLLIGWLATYLFIGRGPSKTELTGKLAAVEEEFETHKENVDKHFETTSELVNELTESYVKVYKHLSEGAEQLGGVVDMRNRLTLDKEDGAPDNTQSEELDAGDGGNGKVIEGALATATVAMTEDPDFTISDAAVEETLTELEQTQTKSETAFTDTAADDVAKNDTNTNNNKRNANKRASRKKRKARNKNAKSKA